MKHAREFAESRTQLLYLYLLVLPRLCVELQSIGPQLPCGDPFFSQPRVNVAAAFSQPPGLLHPAVTSGYLCMLRDEQAIWTCSASSNLQANIGDATETGGAGVNCKQI